MSARARIRLAEGGYIGLDTWRGWHGVDVGRPAGAEPLEKLDAMTLDALEYVWSLEQTFAIAHVLDLLAVTIGRLGGFTRLERSAA